MSKPARGPKKKRN